MVLMESDSRLDRGDPAPDFELPGTDGETYTLDSFDTAALLIVFTCNHCPYAKAKFDLLNELAADYDDLSVVGINPNDASEKSDDSFEAMREYVADGTIAYDAYLRDEDGAVADAYDAVCTPDPFLFGRADAGVDSGATGGGERPAGDREEPTRGGEAVDGDEWMLRYHGRLDDALNPDDEPTEYYVREAVESVLAGDDVGIPDRPSQGCSIKWPER